MSDIFSTLTAKFSVPAKPNDVDILRQLMSWYTNKKFYKRNSSKSGKEILSVYPPEFEGPVYSYEEWHSDDWETSSLELDTNILS